MSLDPQTIQQIASAVENLGIKAAILYFLKEGITDVAKSGYENLKEIIREKANKSFCFTPNKDEANFLKRAVERAYFQEFNRLLPKHPYSDLIRTGYLVSHLNKLGGNAQRVEEIRGTVSMKPNGIFLIRVLNLVTTGAIVPVVDYLSELKKKGYDEQYLNSQFDEIINDWSKYTYFVKSDFSEGKIFDDIKVKIIQKQKIIMIFSIGSAKRNTTLAVAKLLKEDCVEGYFYDSKNNKEGDKEVHASFFSLD